MGNLATGYEPPRSDLEPLLSIADVARVLGVTTKTVYRLLADRELHASRVGSRLRFEPAEIRRYIADGREANP